MTELDVALWLGMVCVALAMVSFCWGLVRGIASTILVALLVPLSLSHSASLLPEFGLAACLLIAAVVPTPKRLGLKADEAAQTNREEEPVLQ